MSAATAFALNRGLLLFRPDVGGLWVMLGYAAQPIGPDGLPSFLRVARLAHLPWLLWSALPSLFNDDVGARLVAEKRLEDTVEEVSVHAVVPVAAGDVTVPMVAQYIAALNPTAFDMATLSKLAGAATVVALSLAVTGYVNLYYPPTDGWASVLLRAVAYLAAPDVERRSAAPALQNDDVAAAGKQFASVISSIASRAESPSLSVLYQGFVAAMSHGEESGFEDAEAAAKRVDEAAVAMARVVKRRIDLLQLEESSSAPEPKRP